MFDAEGARSNKETIRDFTDFGFQTDRALFKNKLDNIQSDIFRE